MSNSLSLAITFFSVFFFKLQATCHKLIKVAIKKGSDVCSGKGDSMPTSHCPDPSKDIALDILATDQPGAEGPHIPDQTGSLYLMNSINWPASSIWVFIAQLGEHCSANAEATGSIPVEASKNFFSGYFRNCLNCDSLRWSHTHFIRI